jgi:hypothetical protein
MTEEQYWDKDCNLVKAYRKADELKQERKNQELWLQGRYYYDALLSVAPVLHAFAKKGTKPSPYMEQPYPLTQKSVKAREEAKEKFTYDKNKAWMEAFMAKNNKKYKKER